MAKDDYRAKRAKETARLAKYEKGTGESTSKVDNAILGGVASTMGLRGLGRLGGAMRAGKAAKAASAASKESKAATAAYDAKRARRISEFSAPKTKALTGGKGSQKALTGGKEAPKGSIRWNSKTGAAKKPDVIRDLEKSKTAAGGRTGRVSAKGRGLAKEPEASPTKAVKNSRAQNKADVSAGKAKKQGPRMKI